MAIGQVEFQLHNLHKSYLSFYQSYRIRLLALGPTHSYTQAALQMVETIRNSGGDLFYCGYELKDRVRTLGWSTYPPQSLKFAVALFVNRSQNDTIFSMQQVRSMVASAFLYCKSRLGISESALEAASEEEVLSQLLSAAPSVEVSTSLPISPPCSPGKMSTSPKPKQIRTAHAPIPTEETKKNGASATTKTPPRVFFQPVSKSVLTQAAISAPQISANPPASPVSPKVTWRPIPPGSPLRPQHLRPLSPSQCSAPSISMRNTYTLLRDEREDRLLVVQRSTPRLLRDCLGSKLAAFGLIAWLSETEDTSAGLENDLNRRRKSSIHRPISVRINEARRRSTMKLQQNSASAGTASAAGAKEALGAMLAMRLGPPMGAPPSSSSSKTTTAAAAPATEKKIIPMPPPVPTSWPPIPFSLSGPAEHPDAPKSIAGLLLGSVDGDIGPKPTKPKLKQVQLAALPSLEGTFWIEPQETLIPVRLPILPFFYLPRIIPMYFNRHPSYLMTSRSSLRRV